MNTQAEVAVAKLEQQFFTAEDHQRKGWGFGPKPYLMVCHGCGSFHVVRSEFISVPMSLGFKFADNSMLSVPCYKCPDCPSEVIREAWKNGTKPEAWAKAHSQLGVAVVTN